MHLAQPYQKEAMLTFKVQDMTCGHCVSVVTEAIKSQDDTATIEIDLETKAVNIDSTKPRQLFVDAITEAGYTPS